jgi:hypothetical protein
MPEKGENTFSGCKPEKRTPTIIGGGGNGGKMTPTVIPGSVPPKKEEDKKPHLQPTTIVGSQPPASLKPAATQINPAIIGNKAAGVVAPAGEKSPAASATVIKPTPHPVVIDKPSAIVGVVRKGLEVTREELLKQFPGTDEEVVERARKQLAQVVIEVLDEGTCAQWGMAPQKEYGALVEESLQLSGDQAVQNCARHLARLLVLLTEVASAFQDNHAGGFFRKRKNPWEKFQEIRPEIVQLAGLLSGLSPTVFDLKRKLDSLDVKYVGLIKKLDAESISARYLADKFSRSSGKENAAQALLDRSLSLAQATAQVQQGRILRQSTVQEIGKLISRIQDGVLNKLPAWIEQVGVFQTKGALTDTDRYNCRQGIDDVINHVR